MGNFASRYWNLTQAAAWVAYRSRQLVEDFASPSRRAWTLINFYPTLPSHEKHGSVQELHDALVDGRLHSWGRRLGDADRVVVIPSIEWAVLQLRLPSVYRLDPEKGEVSVWFDIRLESKDLKKFWRSILEKEGRTRYDWKKLRELWEETRRRLPDVSENEVIEEIEKAFVEHFKKPGPSRTSIQTHMKAWKVAGHQAG